MIFAEIRKHDGYVTIDGYSKYKTLPAVARDIGKFIRDHVDYDEGQNIINYSDDGECWVSADWGSDFVLEAEEVPSASCYNEKKDEVEYAEANWYVACRLVYALSKCEKLEH